ncbi:MAG: NAD-binding protein [Antricoccus sp.]
MRLVDAPVSGGVVRAGEGKLLIMTSSRPADRHDADEVLAALGDPVKVVGDLPGDGQVVKLVNQLLCGVHIVAAAEALALATRLGVPAADAWDTVRHGAAASFMLDDRGQRMVDKDFDVVRSAVDIFVKDMGLVTAAAHAHGMNSILAQAAQQVYVDASEAGLGKKDDASIITRYL